MRPAQFCYKFIFILWLLLGMCPWYLLYFSTTTLWIEHSTDLPGQSSLFPLKVNISGVTVHINVTNVSYKELDWDIDHIHQVKLPFAEKFRSPCWYETVTNISGAYVGNMYARFRDRPGLIQEDFEKMRVLLAERKDRDGVAWRLRCLPYFYVAGAPRCATTDLMTNMLKHTQVVFTLTKESVYWNRIRYLRPEIIGDRDRNDIGEVPVSLQHFLELRDLEAENVRLRVENGMVTGDASPSYMYDFDAWQELPVNKRKPTRVVPDLIHTVTPNAKIIFILRNPVTRLMSDYNFFYLEGNRRRREDFHRLVLQSIEQFQSCLKKQRLYFCLHDRKTGTGSLPLHLRVGLYLPYLMEWYRVFPASNILVLRFEDYVADRAAVLRRVFRFLELRPVPEDRLQMVMGREPRNTSPQEQVIRTMLNETLETLTNFYQPWNNHLAAFFHDDRFLWKDDNVTVYFPAERDRFFRSVLNGEV